VRTHIEIFAIILSMIIIKLNMNESISIILIIILIIITIFNQHDDYDNYKYN